MLCMDTVDEELEVLVDQYSDEELQQAEHELENIALSLSEQEEIEEELAALSSRREFYQEHAKEVLAGTIVDCGRLDKDNVDFDPMYFDVRYPCGETHRITFTDSEVGPNKNKLELFLSSIDCTITDLEGAVGTEVPVSYVFSQTTKKWYLHVFYADREQTKDFLRNKKNYMPSLLGVNQTVQKSHTTTRKVMIGVCSIIMTIGGSWFFSTLVNELFAMIFCIGVVFMFSLFLSMVFLTETVSVKSFRKTA